MAVSLLRLLNVLKDVVIALFVGFCAARFAVENGFNAPDSFGAIAFGFCMMWVDCDISDGEES